MLADLIYVPLSIFAIFIVICFITIYLVPTEHIFIPHYIHLEESQFNWNYLVYIFIVLLLLLVPTINMINAEHAYEMIGIPLMLIIVINYIMICR